MQRKYYLLLYSNKIKTSNMSCEVEDKYRITEYCQRYIENTIARPPTQLGIVTSAAFYLKGFWGPECKSYQKALAIYASWSLTVTMEEKSKDNISWIIWNVYDVINDCWSSLVSILFKTHGYFIENCHHIFFFHDDEILNIRLANSVLI